MADPLVRSARDELMVFENARFPGEEFPQLTMTSSPSRTAKYDEEKAEERYWRQST